MRENWRHCGDCSTFTLYLCTVNLSFCNLIYIYIVAVDAVGLLLECSPAQMARVDDVGMKELKFDMTEKRRLKDLEEVYAIMRACDALEAAYVRDAIPPEQYTPLCASMIGKFDQAVSVAVASGSMRDVRSFMAEFGVQLPAAEKRLLVEKVPATAVHMTGVEGRDNVAYLVDVLPAFVTLIDFAAATRVVEALRPHLSFMCNQLASYHGLPSTWEGRLKLQWWLTKLSGMNANDELSVVEGANLKMDAEIAYEQFTHALKSGPRNG